MNEISRKITYSALWAAYGDALGFITELADARTVKRRVKSDKVTRPVPWSKLVGGKFGTTVPLPAGSYSDDTQLRLSTSRCIDSSGHFDVEAFAKIELPVWLGYSLGAGISTKAAAAALSSPNVTWFSNFFDTERAVYARSGGNGAAMRIQPLVWACGTTDSFERWIQNVIRNSICTHGHPRAIAGAVFHARCISWALKNNRVPSPDEWHTFNNELRSLPKLIQSDKELATFWLPTWTEKVGIDPQQAFEQVIRECELDLSVAEDAIRSDGEKAFDVLVERLGGTTPESRGSGTKTAILAAILAWLSRSRDPEQALELAANHLNSDTDSIATMAGAILGCVAKRAPRFPIQDEEYIRSDADRLARIAQGCDTPRFKYPDLLQWHPPRTQLEVVVKDTNRLQVVGLGEAEPIGETFLSRKGDAVWQWLRLSFGQTILAKRRGDIEVERPQTDRARNSDKEMTTVNSGTEQVRLFPSTESGANKAPRTLHELTAIAIKSGFNPAVIGEQILSLAENPDGIELCIAYVSILAKARLARLEAFSRSGGER